MIYLAIYLIGLFTTMVIGGIISSTHGNTPWVLWILTAILWPAALVLSILYYILFHTPFKLGVYIRDKTH